MTWTDKWRKYGHGTDMMRTNGEKRRCKLALLYLPPTSPAHDILWYVRFRGPLPMARLTKYLSAFDDWVSAWAA